MKRSLLRMAVVVLSAGACLAEDITLASNTIMRADRSLVSIKAGTVVEVLDKGDKTISIRYKGQIGTIPISSLTAAAPSATPAAAAKPASPAPKTAPAAGSLVADHPQSFYGNLVKKAETNIAKHDQNLVKPANDATDDTTSK